MHDVHEGLGDCAKATSMGSHRGRTLTYEKISERFYWYNISNDVANYIKMCEKCQKHQSIPKQNSKVQSIPVPSEVMKQIGVNICNLPTVDGYKHLVVAKDYFSKWSEANPLKDKLAISVAEFLYELVCRHGCFQIQINDQGREFVNAVADRYIT